MSIINPALLAQGFSTNTGAIDLERSPGNALAQSLVRAPLGDNFAPSVPGPTPVQGFGGFGAGAGLGGFGNLGGQNGLGGLLASLLGSLDNILGMLVGLFNQQSQPQPPGPTPAPTGETAFNNATASSVGDPHESFSGTNAAGASVNGKWDNMSSHANLLSSDSFDGGYRVSTAVTSPGANGVTLNSHVGVATDGGHTNVGMNGDGSYDVSSFGRHVDLVAGQAVRLGANESVTLNADKSLTIDETNANGGSIATTLRSNGRGVDVSNTAANVDLGGYLVSKSDTDADPVALAGMQGGGYPQAPGWNNTIHPIYGGTNDLGAMASGYGRTSPQSNTGSVEGSFAAEPYELEES